MTSNKNEEKKLDTFHQTSMTKHKSGRVQKSDAFCRSAHVFVSELFGINNGPLVLLVY